MPLGSCVTLSRYMRWARNTRPSPLGRGSSRLVARPWYSFSGLRATRPDRWGSTIGRPPDVYTGILPTARESLREYPTASPYLVGVPGVAPEGPPHACVAERRES